MTKCCHLKVVILYCISLTDHYSFLEGREGGGREGGREGLSNYQQKIPAQQQLLGKIARGVTVKKKIERALFTFQPPSPLPPPQKKKYEQVSCPRKLPTPSPLSKRSWSTPERFLLSMAESTR